MQADVHLKVPGTGESGYNNQDLDNQGKKKYNIGWREDKRPTLSGCYGVY